MTVIQWLQGVFESRKQRAEERLFYRKIDEQLVFVKSDWQEYVVLHRAMYRAGSIQRLKDLWWDVRSCPRFGTLEIRICDQSTSLAEVLGLTAFIHALALWFQSDQAWPDEMPRPNARRLRDDKWRAMRYGLQAQLVVNNQGETRPIADDIIIWLMRVQPQVERYGYRDYIKVLEEIISRGNSGQRQRRVWSATHDLEAVARFNCDEFAARRPLWNSLENADENRGDEAPRRNSAG
ncbi:MAG: hypothetical protein WB816_15170 [Methylocystis sp.]